MHQGISFKLTPPLFSKWSTTRGVSLKIPALRAEMVENKGGVSLKGGQFKGYPLTPDEKKLKQNWAILNSANSGSLNPSSHINHCSV